MCIVKIDDGGKSVGKGWPSPSYRSTHAEVGPYSRPQSCAGSPDPLSMPDPGLKEMLQGLLDAPSDVEDDPPACPQHPTGMQSVPAPSPPPTSQPSFNFALFLEQLFENLVNDINSTIPASGLSASMQDTILTCCNWLATTYLPPKGEAPHTPPQSSMAVDPTTPRGPAQQSTRGSADKSAAQQVRSTRTATSSIKPTPPTRNKQAPSYAQAAAAASEPSNKPKRVTRCLVQGTKANTVVLRPPNPDNTKLVNALPAIVKLAAQHPEVQQTIDSNPII